MPRCHFSGRGMVMGMPPASNATATLFAGPSRILMEPQAGVSTPLQLALCSVFSNEAALVPSPNIGPRKTTGTSNTRGTLIYLPQQSANTSGLLPGWRQTCHHLTGWWHPGWYPTGAGYDYCRHLQTPCEYQQQGWDGPTRPSVVWHDPSERWRLWRGCDRRYRQGFWTCYDPETPMELMSNQPQNSNSGLSGVGQLPGLLDYRASQHQSAGHSATQGASVAQHVRSSIVFFRDRQEIKPYSIVMW